MRQIGSHCIEGGVVQIEVLLRILFICQDANQKNACLRIDG